MADIRFVSDLFPLRPITAGPESNIDIVLLFFFFFPVYMFVLQIQSVPLERKKPRIGTLESCSIKTAFKMLKAEPLHSDYSKAVYCNYCKVKILHSSPLR